MIIKDGSFVVIFKEETKSEVFLVYRSDKPIWNLPGGGIEPGETPKQAAIREIFEETGFIIRDVVKKGRYTHLESKTGNIRNTTYLFTAHIQSGLFKPEFAGCKGEWFAVNQLPDALQSITAIRVADAHVSTDGLFEKNFTPTD